MIGPLFLVIALGMLGIMLRMRPWVWVSIVLLVCMCTVKTFAQDCEEGAFGCGHQENHDLYKEWNARPWYNDGQEKRTGSCCNGQDCRPVRAMQDWEGHWSIWIPEWKKWVLVPDHSVDIYDRFHDGRSHACTTPPTNDKGTGLTIYCFSPALQKG